MARKFSIYLLTTLLFGSVLSDGLVAQGNRSRAAKAQPNRQKATQTLEGMAYKFPSSMKDVKRDTVNLSTEFGATTMVSVSGEKKDASAFVSVYTIDTSRTELRGSSLLDTLQARVVGNYGGEVYRRFSLLRNGYPSRTAFFSAKASDGTTYLRFEVILVGTKVYQAAFSARDKKGIEGGESQAFFSGLVLRASTTKEDGGIRK